MSEDNLFIKLDRDSYEFQNISHSYNRRKFEEEQQRRIDIINETAQAAQDALIDKRKFERRAAFGSPKKWAQGLWNFAQSSVEYTKAAFYTIPRGGYAASQSRKYYELSTDASTRAYETDDENTRKELLRQAEQYRLAAKEKMDSAQIRNLKDLGNLDLSTKEGRMRVAAISAGAGLEVGSFMPGVGAAGQATKATKASKYSVWTSRVLGLSDIADTAVSGAKGVGFVGRAVTAGVAQAPVIAAIDTIAQDDEEATYVNNLMMTAGVGIGLNLGFGYLGRGVGALADAMPSSRRVADGITETNIGQLPSAVQDVPLLPAPKDQVRVYDFTGGVKAENIIIPDGPDNLLQARQTVDTLVMLRGDVVAGKAFNLDVNDPKYQNIKERMIDPLVERINNKNPDAIPSISDLMGKRVRYEASTGDVVTGEVTPDGFRLDSGQMVEITKDVEDSLTKGFVVSNDFQLIGEGEIRTAQSGRQPFLLEEAGMAAQRNGVEVGFEEIQDKRVRYTTADGVEMKGTVKGDVLELDNGRKIALTPEFKQRILENFDIEGVNIESLDGVKGESLEIQQNNTERIVSKETKVKTGSKIKPSLRINDTDVWLSGEIAEKVSKLKADHKKYVDQIKKQKVWTGGQTKDEVIKGEAMKLSAELRKLTGQLTPTEKNNLKKRLSSNYVGKVVVVDGVEGQISGTPSFGKYPIKFVDGSTGNFKKDEFQSKFTTQELLDKELTVEGVSTQAPNVEAKFQVEEGKPESLVNPPSEGYDPQAVQALRNYASRNPNDIPDGKVYDIAEKIRKADGKDLVDESSVIEAIRMKNYQLESSEVYPAAFDVQYVTAYLKDPTQYIEGAVGSPVADRALSLGLKVNPRVKNAAPSLHKAMVEKELDAETRQAVLDVTLNQINRFGREETTLHYKSLEDITKAVKKAKSGDFDDVLNSIIDVMKKQHDTTDFVEINAKYVDEYRKGVDTGEVKSNVTYLELNEIAKKEAENNFIKSAKNVQLPSIDSSKGIGDILEERQQIWNEWLLKYEKGEKVKRPEEFIKDLNQAIVNEYNKKVSEVKKEYDEIIQKKVKDRFEDIFKNKIHVSQIENGKVVEVPIENSKIILIPPEKEQVFASRLKDLRDDYVFVTVSVGRGKTGNAKKIGNKRLLGEGDVFDFANARAKAKKIIEKEIGENQERFLESKGINTSINIREIIENDDISNLFAENGPYSRYVEALRTYMEGVYDEAESKTADAPSKVDNVTYLDEKLAQIESQGVRALEAFNTESVKLDRVQTDIDILQGELKKHPGKALQKYTLRKEGELPEIGDLKTMWGRNSDDISRALGFEDENAAIDAYNQYKDLKADLQALKDERSVLTIEVEKNKSTFNLTKAERDIVKSVKDIDTFEDEETFVGSILTSYDKLKDNGESQERINNFFDGFASDPKTAAQVMWRQNQLKKPVEILDEVLDRPVDSYDKDLLQSFVKRSNEGEKFSVDELSTIRDLAEFYGFEWSLADERATVGAIVSRLDMDLQRQKKVTGVINKYLKDGELSTATRNNLSTEKGRDLITNQFEEVRKLVDGEGSEDMIPVAFKTALDEREYAFVLDEYAETYPQRVKRNGGAEEALKKDYAQYLKESKTGKFSDRSEILDAYYEHVTKEMNTLVSKENTLEKMLVEFDRLNNESASGRPKEIDPETLAFVMEEASRVERGTIELGEVETEVRKIMGQLQAEGYTLLPEKVVSTPSLDQVDEAIANGVAPDRDVSIQAHEEYVKTTGTRLEVDKMSAPQKEQRFFKRVAEEKEMSTKNPVYTEQNVKQAEEYASRLVDTDLEAASRVAKRLETTGDPLQDAVVAQRYAGKMFEIGNIEEATDVVTKISMDATNAGKFIRGLRDSELVDPATAVRKVVDAKRSRVKNQVEQEIPKAKKDLSDIQVNKDMLSKILDDLTCK